jgi:hypothetical protein
LISIKSKLQIIDSTEFNGYYVKSYKFPLIPGDKLDYLVWPSHYEYMSRIGYFWEFFFNLYHPTIDPITDIRCYNDQDIEYVADWWDEWGEPCDYEYKSQVGEIESGDSHRISVYPTVSKDVFTIKLSGDLLNYLLTITSMDGHRHQNLIINEDIQIFGGNLSAGLYLIRLYNPINMNLLYTSKIVKL